MERGILTQEYRHEPVMLGEVLESLRLKSGSVVCDCTLGGAGHSVKMAAQVGETGLLLGVDQAIKHVVRLMPEGEPFFRWPSRPLAPVWTARFPASRTSC